MGIIGELFDRVEARQSKFFDSLSSEARQKLADVENRYGELRVTGPEGGLFYFQYKGQRLKRLHEPPPVPDEKLDQFLLDGDLINYPSGDEVLFDVADKSLSPRAVIARKYFRVKSNQIIYDTEEFAQAFERLLDDMQVVLGR